MAIVADFTGGPNFGIAPWTVDFTNLSTGGAIGWDWTFGDGFYSSAENPSHDYLYGGEYTIRLNAYDSTSSDLETKYDYIYTSMSVGFECIPMGGDPPPIEILMDNTGSGAVSWNWKIYKDIPDNNYGSYTPYIDSTEESFTYNFTENGAYSVTLTGYSPYIWWPPYQGRSEFEYFSIGVIADFTSNVRGLVAAGTQIDFQDLSSRNPTGWLWDFGDGTTSALQNPSHTYIVENGSIDITLTSFKGDQSDVTSSEDYLRLSNMNWAVSVEDWDWRVIHQLTEFNGDLFAATNRILGPKIRRSSNDGSTWVSVLDATGYSIAIKDDTLYVPTAASSDGTQSNNGGIYTSTDGTNWDRTNITFNFLPLYGESP